MHSPLTTYLLTSNLALAQKRLNSLKTGSVGEPQELTHLSVIHDFVGHRPTAILGPLEVIVGYAHKRRRPSLKERPMFDGSWARIDLALAVWVGLGIISALENL